MGKSIKYQSEEYSLNFTPIYALGLALCIIIYVADIAFDVILAVTYLLDGYYWYCIITILLVLFPTLIVQIFSIRWHVMDEDVDNATWIIHGTLLGVLHRYLIVISNGVEATRSKDYVDYQRFYQQLSDVCMLRLFGSFLEAAPQLLFQLYVLLERAEWPIHQIAWTGISAIVSMISVGWGIAEYSTTLRIVRSDKQTMSWTGRILQTIWRFGMLTARIVALLLLAQAIHEWIIIVLFFHWLFMTLWIITQKTDFCSNVWEERLYNAVVGVIYCFAFFNLKEGKSRYRATIFYITIVAENFAFAAIYLITPSQYNDEMKLYMGVGGFILIAIFTVIGMSTMLFYYRFFHPAGQIKICGSYQEKKDIVEDLHQSHNKSKGPDFEIEEVNYETTTVIKNLNEDLAPERPPKPPRPPPRKGRVQYSRSFKGACPPTNRYMSSKGPTSNYMNTSPTVSSSSDTMKNENLRMVGAADSAYGTDSNRTVSRSTASPPQFSPLEQNSVQEEIQPSHISPAYGNSTYNNMPTNQSTIKNENDEQNAGGKSIGKVGDEISDFSQCSQISEDSRITVIEKTALDNEEEPKKLLKRSPIVKDVTSGFAEVTPISSVLRNVSSGIMESTPKKAPSSPEKMAAPLTIIIPNISHQAFARNSNGETVKLASTPTFPDNTIPLEVLNPNKEKPVVDIQTPHDYENLALVNINRAAFGVTHWRTYSDMANNGHDYSTSYERKKSSNSDYSNYGNLQYYDIYPLSREMKEKLYKNINPPIEEKDEVKEHSNLESDTYEPIEVFSGFAPNPTLSVHNYANLNSQLPLTLIHHDGHNMMTKQVVSLDNLKEALQHHENVPMDNPQDRSDLYLLAPMRLLTPIIEEAEHESNATYKTESVYSGMTYSNYGGIHKSILSVISEILSSPQDIPLPNVQDLKSIESNKNDKKDLNSETSPSKTYAQVYKENHDQKLTTSSLVHTIDEIRNTSFCNLYFASSPVESCKKQIVHLVRSESDSSDSSVIYKSAKKSPVKSINSNTLVPSPSGEKKLLNSITNEQVPNLPDKPVSNSIGCRKNILELAGQGNNILNTPKRPTKNSSSLLTSQNNTMQEIGNNSLHSINKNFMPLSPSSKYETPTPPLKGNEFLRNAGYGRQPTRRKFSMIREKFEPGSNHDLYQNISDDLLNNDISQISFHQSIDFIDSKTFGLKADDKYENIHRGGWATSSTRESTLSYTTKRQQQDRRKSWSENKENDCPEKDTTTARPTIKKASHVMGIANMSSTTARAYRIGSLSPNSKVFDRKN